MAGSKKTKRARRTPKQERSLALVDAVLEATAQILRDHGPEAASTNRIAARAGVSIGSLYQYFPNKTALFSAVSERHVAQLDAQAQAIIDEFDARPAEELVRFAVESFFRIIRVDAPLHAALQRISLWGLSTGALEHFRTRTEQALAQLLIARLSEFEPDIPDPDLAARIAMRALAGIVDVSILEDPAAVHDPALMEETIRLMEARFRPRRERARDLHRAP